MSDLVVTVSEEERIPARRQPPIDNMADDLGDTRTKVIHHVVYGRLVSLVTSHTQLTSAGSRMSGSAETVKLLVPISIGGFEERVLCYFSS